MELDQTLTIMDTSPSKETLEGTLKKKGARPIQVVGNPNLARRNLTGLFKVN